jgi:hypothetical protein
LSFQPNCGGEHAQRTRRLVGKPPFAVAELNAQISPPAGAGRAREQLRFGRESSLRSKCSSPLGRVVATAMNEVSYAGYRFPPEIIHQTVWLDLRFTPSLSDVEDLLAERGVAVSYESDRRRVNHFGPMIAADLRKRCPERMRAPGPRHSSFGNVTMPARAIDFVFVACADGRRLKCLLSADIRTRACHE